MSVSSTSHRTDPAEGPAPTEPRRDRRPRLDLWLIGGLVLLVVFLLPALHAGYRGDDTWTSEVQGSLELENRSLLDLLWESGRTFWESGRPNVLGTTQGLFFSWALNDMPVAYHLVLVLLVAVAAWALYALVRELGLSRILGLLVLVVVAGTIQLRSFHDPILGYWGTTQIVLAFTLVSLLFFARWLRTGERRHLIWSFLLFLPCPLLYEGAYPLVVLHFGLALSERRGWAAVRASLPFLVLGGAFVLLSLYLRATATSVVPGYEVSGSMWGALRTFLIQLFAPIPGSTLIFHGEYANFLALGGSPTKAELLAGAWRGAAVFAIALAVGWSLFRDGRDRVPAPGVLGRIAVVGLLLWTSSVLAVSAAPKYQLELVAGKGHLPTVIQSFGWALVIVPAFLTLARIAARRSTAALRLVLLGVAALVGFGAAVDGYNNVRVVALEIPFVKARDLLETSAADGVLDSVPEGASLLFTPRDIAWNTGTFWQVPNAMQAMLVDRAGRRYDSRPISPTTRLDCAPTEASADCLAPLEPDAAWVRVRTRPGGGSVIVARLDGTPNGRADRRVARDITVYARDDGGGVPDPPRLIASTASGRPWDSGALAWKRTGQGDGWAIYSASLPRGRAPVAATLDDSVAKVDFTALPPSEGLVRIYGTKQLLP